MDDRLYRSVDDRMLAGVAGGVAERLDADPSIVRVVWAMLIVVTGGLALIAYIVMAIVVPDDPRTDPNAETPGPPPAPASPGADPAAVDPDAPTTGSWIGPDGRTVSRGQARRDARRERRASRDDRGPLLAGLILILVGSFFLLRQFIPAIDLGAWWPILLVGIGVLLVVVSVTPRRSG